MIPKPAKSFDEPPQEEVEIVGYTSIELQEEEPEMARWLSLAFYSSEGEIVGILTLDPAGRYELAEKLLAKVVV